MKVLYIGYMPHSSRDKCILNRLLDSGWTVKDVICFHESDTLDHIVTDQDERGLVHVQAPLYLLWDALKTHMKEGDAYITLTWNDAHYCTPAMFDYLENVESVYKARKPDITLLLEGKVKRHITFHTTSAQESMHKKIVTLEMI